MDTVISITAYASDITTARNAVEKGFAAFEEVEKEASFHIKDSQLSILNQKNELAARGMIKELLLTAYTFHEQTQGYFDPSFARLHKAYGFYEKEGRLPDTDELKKLLAQTGFSSKLIFNQKNQIFKLASGSLIDLGGVAGGYAIKKAATAMRNANCDCFLIDDSGDIWVEGTKPDKTPWKIAVRDPRNNGMLAIIETEKPLAVSTSGNYERFVTINGKKYGHIMNPFSGTPADYYQSLTIIASSPVQADAFSTSLYAMPPDELYTWADKNNFPVLTLSMDNHIKMNESGKKWFKLLKE
jgi:thiamine biosynthesis lipoprotein